MRSIINWIKREPVRAFTIANGLAPIVVSGLLVFDAWQPTDEQLTYVVGLPAAVGIVFGVSAVRNSVTPNRANWPPPQGAPR